MVIKKNGNPKKTARVCKTGSTNCIQEKKGKVSVIFVNGSTSEGAQNQLKKNSSTVTDTAQA